MCEGTNVRNDAAQIIGAILALAAAATSLAGCDWPFKSDYREHLSVVLFATAPGSAAVGSTFQVAIVTQGSSGCWQQGDDRVSRSGPLQVYIAPFDREYMGTGICADNAPRFQHGAQIAALAKGTMEIYVLRRLRAASGADSTGVIQLRVDVR